MESPHQLPHDLPSPLTTDHRRKEGVTRIRESSYRRPSSVSQALCSHCVACVSDRLPPLVLGPSCLFRPRRALDPMATAVQPTPSQGDAPGLGHDQNGQHDGIGQQWSPVHMDRPGIVMDILHECSHHAPSRRLNADTRSRLPTGMSRHKLPRLDFLTVPHFTLQVGFALHNVADAGARHNIMEGCMRAELT